MLQGHLRLENGMRKGVFSLHMIPLWTRTLGINFKNYWEIWTWNYETFDWPETTILFEVTDIIVSHH